MTAINAGGYGVIYLTPNQTFDFGSGGSITFEMSTERGGARDWVDLMITPFAQNLAVPLLSDLSQGVDLNGYPLNAIHVGMDNAQGAPVLKLVRNGTVSCQAGCNPGAALDQGIAASVNQAATRQTFRLTVENGRIRFERLASQTAAALVYWDVAATPSFNSGIVQFGHHSYTPGKDGGQPNTWHWDNITLSASTPFTMIKADRRYTQGGVVNFQQPAPANSFLRFSGICGVRVDGVPVSRAPSVVGADVHEEHMSSFWVPIAQGKSSVNITFGPDGWYSGPCIAKDFAIWQTPGGVAPPTATPTRTATAPANTPPASSVAVSGSVVLEGGASPAGVTVRAEPGGVAVVTSGSGAFTLTGLQANVAYTITASRPGFIDVRRTGLQVASGTAQIGQGTLRAGDVDDDNAVTVLDVSMVAGLYGAEAAGNAADFNLNGVVDVTDVSLAAGNYGLTGPTPW